jgi:hypothetical protein
MEAWTLATLSWIDWKRWQADNSGQSVLNASCKVSAKTVELDLYIPGYQLRCCNHEWLWISQHVNGMEAWELEAWELNVSDELTEMQQADNGGQGLFNAHRKALASWTGSLICIRTSAEVLQSEVTLNQPAWQHFRRLTLVTLPKLTEGIAETLSLLKHWWNDTAQGIMYEDCLAGLVNLWKSWLSNVYY